MTEHSEWTWSPATPPGNIQIKEGGRIVATTFAGEWTAALICRAVNAHSELLAALEDILPYAERHVRDADAKSAGELYPAIRAAALERARAAIARAQP